MRTVLMYELKTIPLQTIATHESFKPLHIGVAHNSIFLWALVDNQTAITSREILIRGTGKDVPDEAGPYIGTAILNDGSFVLHVFTCTPSPKAG